MALAETLKANLRRLREARGYSQEELGNRCQPKISQQMIARLEKGDRKMTAAYIETVAEALGVDPVALIRGEDRADRPELRLSEQVASEVARVLGTVALDGEEPSPGTVQVLALMLQELTLTFARHPEALSNPAVVRPVTDSLARQLARA